MSKILPFYIYCIEQYKSEKGYTGKQTIELFKKHGVDEYIYSCYEALHTVGAQYIVADIDGFIVANP